MLNQDRPRQPNFKQIARDELSAQFEVSWPQHCVYFAGHFPDVSVLPGVVQVDWAIYLGRQLFALPVHFSALQLLKFQQVIFPDSVVVLRLSFDPQKNALGFSYSSLDKQHSSGKVIFAA
jgi:3-hydroxymyristoyl/3-hydroxydecanoyl-(acyl carrier protein) dehydratase